MWTTGMGDSTVCWYLDLAAGVLLSLTFGKMLLLQHLLAQHVTLQHRPSPASCNILTLAPDHIWSPKTTSAESDDWVLERPML